MKPSPLLFVAALCSWCACSQPSAETDSAKIVAADLGVVKKPTRPRKSAAEKHGPQRKEKVSPPDTRTPAQITNAACALPKGGWACKNVNKTLQPTARAEGATTPIIPSSWTVPAWFFDPQNMSGTASDNNNCTTSATACLTWGEIYVHRLGGPNVNLQQNTAVTELSSQSTGVDLISIVTDPNSFAFHFVGTLTQVATTTIGTFTVRNRTAGTPNTITASGQSGAYWTTYVGDLVHDTTANAWFWIDADLGSATARITEPLAFYTVGGTFPPPYVTIANGDTLSINTESAINAEELGASSYADFTTVQIATPFSVGASGDCLLAQTSTNGTSYVTSNKYGILQGVNSRITPVITGFGDYFGGSIVQLNTFSFSINIGAPTSVGGITFLDGDILIDPSVPDNANSLRFDGNSEVGYAGLLGVMQTNGASAQGGNNLEMRGSLTPGSSYNCALWGPGQVQITNGFTFSFDGGGLNEAADTLLVTGANYSNVPLTFEYATQTTGFPWVTASHAFGPAVALTAANIDAYQGLNWPQTGSKFWFRP